MAARSKFKPSLSTKAGHKVGRPAAKKTVNKPSVSASLKEDNHEGIWSPNIQTAFKALASARLCAAVWNNINDCDETYNYWEPMHYLMYGNGFQTWEYSPVYGLRSYTYLLLHALPAWVYGLILQSNRVLVFYFLRCLLGFICSTFEIYFYKGVCLAFGPSIGRLTLGFLLFSAGMFQASTAFLPSSFSMYMGLLSLGAWLHGKHVLAIFTTALSTYLSWPFAAILGVGIAVDVLLLQKKWRMFLSACILSTLVILVPMTIIDSYFYGRFVIAPLNIVLYNVFSEHGPNLYGTSPWTFYFFNGFLNFNIVFLLAIGVLPVLLVTWLINILSERLIGIWNSHITQCEVPWRKPTLWLTILPFYLWIFVFFTRPHKEERFLYPMYPLIGLMAGISWTCIEFLMKRVKLRIKLVHYLTLALVISSSAISISRIVGQYKGYHAPVDIFLEVNRISWENEHSSRSVHVCIGKEWHRFSSSFFLPDNWKLLFIQSEFRGQLPRPYDPPPNGTWIIPPHMNDLNQEEPTRYASVNECHYLIDLDTTQFTEREPCYSQQMDKWQTVFQVSYLDNLRSHQLLRAFYVPWISEHHCKYIPYVLLKRINPKKKLN